MSDSDSASSGVLSVYIFHKLLSVCSFDLECLQAEREKGPGPGLCWYVL